MREALRDPQGATRKRRRAMLSLGVFGWVVSCVPATFAQLAPEAPYGAYRAEFEGFGQGLAAAFVDSAKHRVIRKRPNRHRPTQMDEERLVSLQGIKVQFTVSGTSPSSLWIEHLSLTRKTIDLPLALKIGVSTPADVVKRLGPPLFREETRISYRSIGDSYCTEDYTFHFTGDRLARVEWQWCYD